MKRLALFPLLVCATLLSACGAVGSGVSSIPTSPASFANATTMDEVAAIKFEQAVTAAADLATLAIETGIVRDAATIARIHAAVPKARAAVAAVRSAYNAGNAESYATAFASASRVIAEIQTLASGDKP